MDVEQHVDVMPETITSSSTQAKNPHMALLPAEMWLAVLAHLEFGDRKHVSLTNRTFRCLTQPLLFHKLVISTSLVPFAHGYGKPSIQQEAIFIRNLLSRIEFFTSEHIASFVRTCSIGNKPNGYHIRDVPIGLVLRRLSACKNLNSLTCQRIYISAEGFQSIKALSSLQRLTIIHCTLMTSNVSRLSLKQYNLYGGTKRWWKILDPDTIECFSLSSVTESNDLYPGNPIPLMRHLHTLHVPCVVVTPLFLSFLSQSPGIQDLCISAEGVDQFVPKFDGTPPADLLPRLNTYYGPDTYLLLCAQGGNLRSVHVWCTEDNSSALSGTLATLGGVAPHIKSLTLRPQYIAESLLETVCLSFPDLRVFDMSCPSPIDVEAIPAGTIRTREVSSYDAQQQLLLG
jgi:hypothetical protein